MVLIVERRSKEFSLFDGIKCEFMNLFGPFLGYSQSQVVLMVLSLLHVELLRSSWFIDYLSINPALAEVKSL